MYRPPSQKTLKSNFHINQLERFRCVIASGKFYYVAVQWKPFFANDLMFSKYRKD